MKLHFNSRTAPKCPSTSFLYEPSDATRLGHNLFLLTCPLCDTRGRRSWDQGYDASKPGQHAYSYPKPGEAFPPEVRLDALVEVGA